MKVKYQGFAIDRFSALKTRKTRYYGSEYAAYKAAEKLCKKWFSGDRGMTHVESIIVLGEK